MKNKIRVENHTTGESFTTTSLSEAQAFRDAHEGQIVKGWHIIPCANAPGGFQESLLVESAASFAKRNGIKCPMNPDCEQNEFGETVWKAKK